MAKEDGRLEFTSTVQDELAVREYLCNGITDSSS